MGIFGEPNKINAKLLNLNTCLIIPLSRSVDNKYLAAETVVHRATADREIAPVLEWRISYTPLGKSVQ